MLDVIDQMGIGAGTQYCGYTLVYILDSRVHFCTVGISGSTSSISFLCQCSGVSQQNSVAALSRAAEVNGR